MVLDDNNSQIGVEFACRNQAKKIHLLDSNRNISNEGRVIYSLSLFVKKQPPQSAYRVKDFSVCKVIVSIYPDL